jgi:ketosteroid isomerase-like protein
MQLREMFVKAALDRGTGAEDRARRAALAYIDTFGNGDIDARVALFAPEASFEDPAGTPPITGHAALRAFWEQERRWMWQ